MALKKSVILNFSTLFLNFSVTSLWAGNVARRLKVIAMKNGCHISFYIKRSAPLKSGEVPIMGRISIGGGRTQFSTHMTLRPAAWDVEQHRAMGRSMEMVRINGELDRLRLGLLAAYDALLVKGGTPTPDEVRDKFFLSTTGRMRLLQLVELHNEAFKRRVGVDRSSSTLYKYQSLQLHLERFLTQYWSVQDLSLAALNRDFITAFHRYLLSDTTLRRNTAWVYLTALKHILLWARRQGISVDDPFVDYRLSNEFVQRTYLSEGELRALMALEIAEPMLELVRDVFLFSCFTGLSFIDLKRLTAANISQLGDHRWIELARHKTGSQVQVRLFDVAVMILDKYLPEDHCGVIFPLPSNSWCNRCLAQLMRRCGIEKRVTFHAARHTFATTLALSHGMPIEAISKLLGHSSIRTTQIYATITRAHLERELNRLSDEIESLSNCWRS